MTFKLCGIGDEAADPIADQLDVVRELGWSALELRSVGGTKVDDLNDLERSAVADAVRAAGIAVPVLDSAIGSWMKSIAAPFEDDLDALDAALALAGLLSTPFVRVMSYPNAGLEDVCWEHEVVRRLGELSARAADAGVVLLHENCSGWASLDGRRAVRLVEQVPQLGLLFDIGNGVAHGYDELAYLKHALPYVRHVQVKDARQSSAGCVEFTFPGDGQVRLVESLRLLADAGYEGFVSLEPHVGRIHHDTKRPAVRDLRSSFIDWARRFETLLASELASEEPNEQRS